MENKSLEIWRGIAWIGGSDAGILQEIWRRLAHISQKIGERKLCGNFSCLEKDCVDVQTEYSWEGIIGEFF